MKKFDVFLMPDAIVDLQTIYDHILEKSGYPQRAWNYIEKLRAKCTDLQYAPERGHKRDDLYPKLRTAAIDKKCVIAFIVKSDKAEVHILNVFYGGRDYELLMKGE